MIFEDPTARRGRFVRVAGLALAVIAFAALGLVALSVLTPPQLPALPSALQTARFAGDAVVVRLDDTTSVAALSSGPSTTPSAATARQRPGDNVDGARPRRRRSAGRGSSTPRSSCRTSK